jgi:hypothetical protein
MPDGRGRAALEAAAHGLAVQVAQQINPEIRTPRRRRQIDRASLVTMIFISVAGGAITWGTWQLGVISPWTWLQWTLWSLAGLVLLFVTLLVTIGGLPELFHEEKKEDESKD